MVCINRSSMAGYWVVYDPSNKRAMYFTFLLLSLFLRVYCPRPRLFKPRGYTANCKVWSVALEVWLMAGIRAGTRAETTHIHTSLFSLIGAPRWSTSSNCFLPCIVTRVHSNRILHVPAAINGKADYNRPYFYFLLSFHTLLSVEPS